MGNKCRRFLVMLTMMFLLISLISVNAWASETESTEPRCYTYGDVNCDNVVDQKDAIDLLYHVNLEGGETSQLPNGRGGDMDGDGDIDKDDAIYLLFHTFPVFAESYPLPLVEVHVYADPVWTWTKTEEGMTASVAIHCDCTSATPVDADVTAETTAATCTKDGQIVYQATAVIRGKEYSNEKTVVLPHTGHDVTRTCEGKTACKNGCGEEFDPLPHDYVLVEDECVAATCGTEGVNKYRCSVCETAEKEEKVPATGKHSLEKRTEQLTSCTYRDVQDCANGCGFSVTGEEYEQHKHTVVTSFTPATCIAAGERTYKCENCTDTKVYPVEIDLSAHTWDAGEEQADKSILYTCTGCNATKVVVAVDNETQIAKDDLSGKEMSLAVDGTSVAMSEDALKAMPDTVLITVTDSDENKANLTEEQKEIIGENKVYDFSVKDAEGNVVEFKGSVTVTLPYTLSEGENIDEIAVWYINENGEAESIPATYADGYITFTTDHFSYYTVTRLTPAERCEIYGHKYGTELTVEPTCNHGGYTQQVCQRCHYVLKENEKPALTHNYQQTNAHKPATCDANGLFSEECVHCHNKVEYVLRALGHDYQKTEDSVATSCKAPGKDVYQCTVCEKSYEIVTAQLEHTYEDVTVNATCTESGRAYKHCTVCGNDETVQEIPALKHSYADDKYADEAKRPVWTWALDEGDLCGDPTVKLFCVNCDHTLEKVAVVHEQDNTSCEGGEIVYTAKASHGKITFEDVYIQTITGGGHTPGEWKHDVNKHQRICTVCSENLDVDEHEWTEKSKIDATCDSKGEVVYKCVCGREKTETLPATGLHSLQNGVCTECGFTSDDCNHVVGKTVIHNLADYGACGGTVEFASCECGEVVLVMEYEFTCQRAGTTEEKTDEDGRTYTVHTSTCETCGLKQVLYNYSYATTEPCGVYNRWYNGLFIGEEEIVEEGGTDLLGDHPAGFNGYVSVDLQSLGLCGEQIEVAFCPCGQNADWNIIYQCDWVETGDDSNTGTTCFICTNCSAEKIIEEIYIENETDCNVQSGTRLTYRVNGKKVYSLERRFDRTRHSFELVNGELLGDTCEDGVYLNYKCGKCDYAMTEYSERHVRVSETVLDLRGYDICAEYAVISKCVCDEGWRYGSLESNSGNVCYWRPDHNQNSADKNVYVCDSCGATKEITYTYGEKDESCLTFVTEKHTYYDKNGKRILTYYCDTENTIHDFETVRTLLGETCEDGVRQYSQCSDCGLTTGEWTYYTHNSYILETWDLTGLNMCNVTRFQISGCVCGENWYATEFCDGSKPGCSRYWIEGEDGHEVTMCDDCGVQIDIYERKNVKIDACHSRRPVTRTYSNGEESVRVSYNQIIEHHEEILTPTLNEGSTTCEDGVTVQRTCANCDYADAYGANVHVGKQLSKELLCEEGLCGPVYFATYRCACGQDAWADLYWPEEECAFNSWEYVEEADQWCYVCENCGAYQLNLKSTGVSVPNSCDVEMTQKHTINKAGVELCSYDSISTYMYHEWQYKFEMYGKTCNDGFDYVATCANCDATQRGEDLYGHNYSLGTYIKLVDDRRVCSPFYIELDTCPCGEDTRYFWTHQCDFAGVWDETLQREVDQCVDCGLIWMQKTTYSEPDEDCNVIATTLHTFMLGDEVVGTYAQTRNEIEHNWTYEFSMLTPGTTCESGYTVRAVCVRCGERGEENTVYNDNCSCTWDLEKKVLHKGDGLCDEFYIREYRCACGANTGYNTYRNCSIDSEWNESMNADVYSCSECGLSYYSTYTYSEPDENCNVTVQETLTLLVDGKVYTTYTHTRTEIDHNWSYEFSMLVPGTTCENGYTVQNVCARCGLKTGDVEEYYTDCGSTWYLEKKVLHKGDGICGEFYIREYRCACGANRGFYEYNACSTKDEYNESLGEYVYSCWDCGLSYYTQCTYTEPDENCNITMQETLTLLVDDEVYTTYTQTRDTKNHEEWVHTFVRYGTSCEDGYDVHRKCTRCGHVELCEENQQDHDKYCVADYDVEDYGLCGGYLSVYSCSCGLERSINVGQYCNYQYTGNNDPETGASERYCEECQTYTYSLYESEHVKEDCLETGREVFKVVRNGEVLVEVDEEISAVSHTYIATDLALDEGAEDCTGGWTACYDCFYCDAGYETSGNNHVKLTVEYVDLSEVGSTCGGYLEQRRCACGEYQDYNYDHPMSWKGAWMEMGADGLEHSYDEGWCDDCDLKVFEDIYVVCGEDSCDGRQYIKRTFTLGDTLNQTLVSFEEGTFHDWGNQHYVLMDESTSCTDGLYLATTCKRCEETEVDTWNPYYGHNCMNMIESVDLAAYGSICGEKLIHYACPCGAEEYWDFDEENHCDLDEEQIDLNTNSDWLQDVIDENVPGGKLIHDWQETTEGEVDSYSYSSVYTCAVTNPEACALKVRMADYWVKVGCEVTRYQTWQLGYNKETGECQREITIATGNKHAYHDFVATTTEETGEDGTKTTVYRDDCPDCGSYHERTYVYKNGKLVKDENLHVNTLNNGEIKRRYYLEEKGHEVAYEYDGESGVLTFRTLIKSERTYADGTEYWERYDYTYGEESCTVNCLYTDSKGDRQETKGKTCHESDWDYETFEESTCTQHGLVRERETCKVCHEVVYENTNYIDPHGHNWYWNDEKQTYFCQVCGLENINSASGSIVMENLTEEDGEDYVIGYWNRGGVEFSTHVSVIFDEWTEDKEWMLDGIETTGYTKENDGFTGMSFSKQAAINAALAKISEQGYEGSSYAIRISFVPVNDQYDLDYAITFDSLTVTAAE